MKKVIFMGVLGLFLLGSCNSKSGDSHEGHNHETEEHNHDRHDHEGHDHEHEGLSKLILSSNLTIFIAVEVCPNHEITI